MKSWRITDTNNIDTMKFYHLEKVILVEFEDRVQIDIKDELQKLINKKDRVTSKDIREHFGYSLNFSVVEVEKVFSEIVEHLRKKDK